MAKAFLEDASSASSDSESENIGALKINEEYAKRFEHNKKREELQRLEEKYGSSVVPKKRKANSDGEDEAEHSDDSSTSEEEDDEAVLATIDVDQQINATLEALRKKDPSIYDKDKKFFEFKEPADGEDTGPKASKPLRLVDYQRQRLLNGDEDSAEPKSFTQLQTELRKEVVGEMNAAVEDSEEDDADFIRPKKRQIPNRTDTLPQITEQDVKMADRNPELYLSNFVASRAWVPSALSRFQPFDSDDDEEEDRAEEFEQAYNMRFENPAGSNEKLMSHARDTVAKYSVRRPEMSSRKKARESKLEKVSEEQAKRDSEKARLKKLRVEEAERKINQICETAGIRRSDVDLDDWAEFLEDAWDDSQWEKKMAEKFGDKYQNEREMSSSSKSKPKKPKWDDDIDIKDLVPDFEEEEPIELSEDEAEAEAEAEDVEMEDAPAPKSKRKSKKAELQERKDRQKAARKQRALVEDFVEKQLDMEGVGELGSDEQRAFRYRQTSPESYGLTVNDILMASDSQLNQYAGLKKLAAYRDPEKKAKDQKKLSKKGRLRQWRKETFGTEVEPTLAKDSANGTVLGTKTSAINGDGHGEAVESHKKSKSKKKHKSKA